MILLTGATGNVGTALLQTRSQVAPLLQVAAEAPPAAPQGEKGELVHSS